MVVRLCAVLTIGRYNLLRKLSGIRDLLGTKNSFNDINRYAEALD